MSPVRPLLALAIPTYNRADRLEILLRRLAEDLPALGDAVSVHVSDNASTDRTPAVLDAFAAAYAGVVAVRQPDNCGADENFARVVESVDADYVWLFGDDDLPARGAIGLLVDLLREHRPDTVHVGSRWVPVDEVEPTASRRPATLEWEVMGPVDLARLAHVWTTFITGWVLRRDDIEPAMLRRHAGSLLAQLGWVLPCLARGRRHLHVRTRVVVAASGNSGGYSRLVVFGRAFPEVTAAALADEPDGPRIAREMVRRSAVAYLPAQLWEARSTLGRAAVRSFELDRAAAGGLVWQRVVLDTVARAPRLVAQATVRLSWEAARAVALADRLRRARRAR